MRIEALVDCGIMPGELELVLPLQLQNDLLQGRALRLSDRPGANQQNSQQWPKQNDQLGVIGHAGTVSVSRESGQLKTVVADNVFKMVSRFDPNHIMEAEWFVHPDVLPQLWGMTDDAGNFVYVPAGLVPDAPYGMLMGKKVNVTSHCAALGEVGDIILGDFSQYAVIERGGMQTASSIHVKFLTDETLFRFVKRINGRPINSDTITPPGGGSTVAPFVTLETRPASASS